MTWEALFLLNTVGLMIALAVLQTTVPMCVTYFGAAVLYLGLFLNAYHP